MDRFVFSITNGNILLPWVAKLTVIWCYVAFPVVRVDDAHIIPCRGGVFPWPVEWGNVMLLFHYPVPFNEPGRFRGVSVG